MGEFHRLRDQRGVTLWTEDKFGSAQEIATFATDDHADLFERALSLESGVSERDKVLDEVAEMIRLAEEAIKHTSHADGLGMGDQERERQCATLRKRVLSMKRPGNILRSERGKEETDG